MTKARDLASAAPAPSTVSATELGYLDGVSSAIQTQIDGKSATAHNHDGTYATSAHNHNSDYIAKTLTTTTGDIIYASSANNPARLGIGSTGNVLTVSGGVPTWAAPAASGGVTLIQRYVPNNSEVQLAFTSISNTYKHLLLVWTGINTLGNFVIRLNNDSGSNYSHDSVSGDTSLGDRSFTATPNQGANEHSAHGYAWIYDANSTSYWKQYVTEKANYSNTYGWQDTHYQGMWRSTSAVSSIYIVCDNSTTLTAVTGGSVALYGVS